MPLSEQVADRRPSARSRAGSRSRAVTNQPTGWRRVRTIAADLLGDRLERVPRLDDRRRRCTTTCGRVSSPSVSRRRALTPRAPARDSGSAAPPGTSSAAACSDPRAGRSCAAAPCSFATRLFGSFRSPKTIASAGQTAWQAVTISPSRIGRSSRFASMRAWLMRCTQ